VVAWCREKRQSQASVAPLTITPRQMTELFERVQNWTALVLHAGAPASFEVRFGETVALDQFVNHSTGQKVTEYLTIKDKGH
jgi:hypothetical protein